METLKIDPLAGAIGDLIHSEPLGPECKSGGGGLGAIIGVAAMIAIPFAAPAIAAGIASSGFLGATISGAMATTAGATISSAVVGAALGAGTAAIMGTDVKYGALGGALGGGLSGFSSAWQGPSAVPVSPSAGNAFQGMRGIGGVGITPGASLAPITPPGAAFSPLSAPGASTFGYSPVSGGSMAFQGAGIGVSPSTPISSAVSPVGAPVSAAPVSAAPSTPGLAQPARQQAFTWEAPAETAAKRTFLQKAGDSLAKAGDPRSRAQMIVQAAAQLGAAGTVPTPPPAQQSPEEQKMLAEYTQEMKALKEKDEKLYNERLKAAQDYLRVAQSYDPQRRALQAQREQQISDAQRIRDMEQQSQFRTGEGLSPGDRRRLELQASLSGHTAYEQGYESGQKRRDSMIEQGYSMLPQGAPDRYARSLAGQTAYLGQRQQQLQAQDKVQAAQTQAKRERAAETYGQLAEGFEPLVEDWFDPEEENKQNQNAGLSPYGFSYI